MGETGDRPGRAGGGRIALGEDNRQEGNRGKGIGMGARQAFWGTAYRIYFCLLKGEAWLVHWAEKKSRKIPAHDVGIIRRRAREVFGK